MDTWPALPWQSSYHYKEKIKPLNLFYEEPDADRWIWFDRYPRRWIRRIVRGKPRPGGQMMIAINLMKGLDKIGIPYRFNDFQYIRKHPKEIACIIGKAQVFFENLWENPVLFGAGIYSHPLEYPELFKSYPNVRQLLVPGEWMRKMFEPYYGNKVISWPVGIDTECWKPFTDKKTVDFLIYYKIRWRQKEMDAELVDPILNLLKGKNLSFQLVRYGNYTPEELLEKTKRSKAAIFLCEHETQGLAYQQILSTNTPILAWDSEGYWQDPAYYPASVQYEPVSSVPYWDKRCGVKFKNGTDFEEKLKLFMQKKEAGQFSPRDYILENLTLEKCAEDYVRIYQDVEQNLS